MVWFWSFCHPEPCAEFISALFRDLDHEHYASSRYLHILIGIMMQS